MKFSLPNGDTVEIKIIPEGAKKEDAEATKFFVDGLELALTRASVFCYGNGFTYSAKEFEEIARALRT